VREGIFQKQTLSNRTYVVFLPKNIIQEGEMKKAPLLIVFHAAGQTSWFTAQNLTGWTQLAEKERFIVAFGQSIGEGWKIAVGGKIDLEYVYESVTEMILDYPIDEDRIYGLGIGNGGLFVSNVAIRHSHTFAAVCNYMGGYKWNFNLSPVEAVRKIPMMIIIGGQDQNLGHAMEAYRVFSELGHPVEFRLEPGIGREYKREREIDIWMFLRRHALWDGQPRSRFMQHLFASNNLDKLFLSPSPRSPTDNSNGNDQDNDKLRDEETHY